jgi:hypothetical protein
MVGADPNMLSANLNGKGRRLPDGLPPGASLRMAFKRSEDILTATVFERLAYLDGDVLWQVLESTFRPKVLATPRLVTLDDVEFWPTWGQARDAIGKAVEPDVVLKLTVGNPPVKVVLIVECKLDDLQYRRPHRAVVTRRHAAQNGRTRFTARLRPACCQWRASGRSR